MKLNVEQVSWGIEGKRIVENISLDVAPGEFVGLIGPNGSGKSSLLRCVYRLFKPDAGLITINGINVWQMSPRKTARRMAVVIQESSSEFDFTVKEIVLMGRLPFKKTFESETESDLRLVEDALKQVDLTHFADRQFISLSGGEKQRVIIARALVQQPKLIVMDEPTNHLDIYHQIEVLDLIKQCKITALVALHDLNLAAFYCDRLYVLKEGHVVANGTVNEVLTPKLIQDVYRVYSEVHHNSRTGKPQITFFPERLGKHLKNNAEQQFNKLKRG